MSLLFIIRFPNNRLGGEIEKKRLLHSLTLEEQEGAKEVKKKARDTGA